MLQHRFITKSFVCIQTVKGKVWGYLMPSQFPLYKLVEPKLIFGTLSSPRIEPVTSQDQEL